MKNEDDEYSISVMDAIKWTAIITVLWGLMVLTSDFFTR